MLDLFKQLNDRLDEINDGSFVVKDDITDYYKNLWMLLSKTKRQPADRPPFS